MYRAARVLALTLLPLAAGCQSEPPSEEPAARRAEAPSEVGPGAQTPAKRVLGQTLYVPAYSHIYLRDRERTINLTTTLSIRNTSLEDSITVTRAAYYDSEGRRVQAYVSGERVLGPLASTAYVIELDDLRGGVGANFLVEWRSEQPVSPPVVETVMITGASTQGISFLSEARVLYEELAEPAGTSSGGD